MRIDTLIKKFPKIKSFEFRIREIKVVENITGEVFEAYEDATSYLEKEGFACGSMQRDSPTGCCIAVCVEKPPKWRDILQKEYRYLDALIVSKRFRNDDVTIVLLHPVEIGSITFSN